jgi:hypothetical protein
MKQLLRGRSGRKNTAQATLKNVYQPFKSGKKHSQGNFPKESPPIKPPVKTVDVEPSPSSSDTSVSTNQEKPQEKL